MHGARRPVARPRQTDDQHNRHAETHPLRCNTLPRSRVPERLARAGFRSGLLNVSSDRARLEQIDDLRFATPTQRELGDGRDKYFHKRFLTLGAVNLARPAVDNQRVILENAG